MRKPEVTSPLNILRIIVQPPRIKNSQRYSSRIIYLLLPPGKCIRNSSETSSPTNLSPQKKRTAFPAMLHPLERWVQTLLLFVKSCRPEREGSTARGGRLTLKGAVNRHAKNTTREQLHHAFFLCFSSCEPNRPDQCFRQTPTSTHISRASIIRSRNTRTRFRSLLTAPLDGLVSRPSRISKRSGGACGARKRRACDKLFNQPVKAKQKNYCCLCAHSQQLTSYFL